MASLATSASSAVWHRWRRSFSSSLNINSFLCSFWLKSLIKFPVEDETLSRVSERAAARQTRTVTSPSAPLRRWAAASFFCWKFWSLTTSSGKRWRLATKETLFSGIRSAYQNTFESLSCQMFRKPSSPFPCGLCKPRYFWCKHVSNTTRYKMICSSYLLRS